MPETTTTAQGFVREVPEGWQKSANGTRQWWSRMLDLPQGRERWIFVRSKEGEVRAHATLQRQAERDHTTWTQRLWHLGNQPFACQVDAEAALAKACQRLPAWIQVQTRV